ncbi:MAG: 3-dehydroquinate synthase [Pseudomonadota bacterium]
MSTPTLVNVALGARTYDVVIGYGLLDQAGSLLAHKLQAPTAILITDRHLEATRHLQRLQNALRTTGVKIETIVLPPGEATKSVDALEQLVDQILALGIDRQTPVIALSGGVIGDLAGFAAAITLRGLPFIQLPTTLLAQVDSSVGGKTGINSRHGKNLIGAFYQPKSVLIDISVLDDLPPREIKAGYAEIIKYGFLYDREFFDWLEVNGGAVIDGDNAARLHAIARSVAIKAEIVAADETERNDLRALLNFGHTFAHAYERIVGYTDALLHGEAVSLGMVKAFELSRRLGHCHGQDSERARAHLEEIGMPVSVQAHLGRKLASDDVINAMYTDKKVVSRKLRFVLARAIGSTFVAKDVDEADVRHILASDG